MQNKRWEELMAEIDGLNRILARFANGAAVVLTASLALAASASAQTKLTFLLNVPPAGYNSGFELAVEKGFYKDVGLDVTIEPGNGSQTTAQLVSVGRYD